jgi:hypothetical protein
MLRVMLARRPQYNSWTVNCEIEGDARSWLMLVLVVNFRLPFRSPRPGMLSPGAHTILARFNYSGIGAGKPADIELLVDGKSVGTARVPNTIPLRLSPIISG